MLNLSRRLLKPHRFDRPEITVESSVAVSDEVLDRWSRDSSASGFAIAEYTALRGESLNARVAMQHIIQWGLAGLSLVFAAGLSLDVDDQQSFLVRQFVFGIALPTYAAVWAAIWIGEVKRMMRVGRYLRARELQVNEALRPQQIDPVLHWETWLSADGPRIWIGILAPLFLFSGAFGICVAVAALGIDPAPIVLEGRWSKGGPFADLPGAVVVIYVAAMFLIYCSVLYFGLIRVLQERGEIDILVADGEASEAAVIE